MAPLPTQPSPTINDFYASSPHVFWAIFGVFAFAFLALLAYGCHWLSGYARKSGDDPRSCYSSPIKKPALRTLLLPRIAVSRDLGMVDQTVLGGKKIWQHHSRTTTPSANKNIKHGASRPGRLWSSITTLWSTLFYKHTAHPESLSRTGSPASRSISPSSKAFVADHDRWWALQFQLVHAGGPLCTGELQPWVPYIPTKPFAAPVLDVVHIAPPQACHTKGRSTFAPATSTPKVSSAPVLTTIEEVEDDSTLEDASDDTLSEDTLWSDSERPTKDAPVPAIVVRACPDAPRPLSVAPQPLFPVHAYGVDYLEVPVPGEEHTQSQSRTLLGAVNRSTHGGRFALRPAPPPRRRPAKPARPARFDENAPAPGWF